MRKGSRVIRFDEDTLREVNANPLRLVGINGRDVAGTPDEVFEHLKQNGYAGGSVTMVLGEWVSAIE